MVCNYTGYTWTILLGMIITGSTRSMLVKLCYQSGLKAPLTITLLYLLGQSFSLFVYGIQRRLSSEYNALSLSAGGDGEEPCEKCVEISVVDADAGIPVKAEPDEEGTECTAQSLSAPSSPTSSTALSPAWLSHAVLEFCASARSSFSVDEIPNGSSHGLSHHSEERVRWAHRVPFYAKPVAPALFNLLNAALRWAALVYLDASVSEMLISGLELTLSVVAARVFRKRMVAKSRWAGVIIVAIGVIIIERGNNSQHQKLESDGGEGGDGKAHGGPRDALIGVTLIVLQSMLSVLQDIGEEIFMQATDFPATVMLGMEGLYGFCIGFVIYCTVGNRFGIEDIDSTMRILGENSKLRWWIVGLPFIFLVTGLFNIKATGVTSAMTRNIWKNMRTVLVWTIALGIYYLGNNSGYGEAWHTPESFVIFCGFMVMCTGIVAYYWSKAQEQ